MQSLNFEVLRKDYPELADLGGFAEQYAYSDPAGAAAKLRTFVRVLTFAIYAHYKLPRSSGTNFVLLEGPVFKSLVRQDVLDKFHSIRKTGNDALYGRVGPITQDIALSRLKDAHYPGKWWAMLALKSDLVSDEFKIPPVQPSLPPEIQKRLKEQEQLLEKTIAEQRMCGSNTTKSRRRALI